MRVASDIKPPDILCAMGFKLMQAHLLEGTKHILTHIACILLRNVNTRLTRGSARNVGNPSDRKLANTLFKLSGVFGDVFVAILEPITKTMPKLFTKSQPSKILS